ncbi:hypothetical protein [Fodinicola feengrottensis]|uniref:Uncharacterized protein n=1 Tax=Fodinicola feengrottensis TaxID=435914 RepID=A0ABP4VB72_9ACTN|nr:hypothetical protein [Fodinicola feengrottensis]
MNAKRWCGVSYGTQASWQASPVNAGSIPAAFIASASALRFDLEWDGFRVLARKTGRGVVEPVSRRQKFADLVISGGCGRDCRARAGADRDGG